MDAFFGDQPLQPFGLQRLGIEKCTLKMCCLQVALVVLFPGRNSNGVAA
jgi:hypothetical protein